MSNLKTETIIKESEISKELKNLICFSSLNQFYFLGQKVNKINVSKNKK